MTNDKMNKTSISSIIALDMIDFAKKSAAEQTQLKQLLNQLIQNAVLDIPQSDRMIMDTPSGAAIACSGPLEDALEDALFISITIRDEILKHNTNSVQSLYVQFGINFGSASAVGSNIVGEGIDEAQRIMRFANPNQILVSNIYFEMASKLTQEISQMFEKYEMHAYEHDVYAVRMLKESSAESSPEVADLAEIAPASAITFNWTYVGLGLLSLAALFALAKLVATPVEPEITLVQPPSIQPATIQAAPIKPIQIEAVEAAPEPIQQVQEEVIIETVPAAVKDKKVVRVQKTEIQKPAQKKTSTSVTKAIPEKVNSDNTENKATTNTADKQTSTKAEKETTKEKSGWQTFKDSVSNGTEIKCTQAEIALNQCTK
jgi:class 3 adenylate cyclase